MSIKSIVLLCLCLVLSTLVVAQLDTTFIRTYGGPQLESGNEILETEDGGYFIIGTTGSVDDVNTNFYLLKIDSLLNFQWSKVYGGVDIDWGQSICPTDDGNFMILGFTNSIGNGEYDMQLYKIDPDGEVLWAQNYGGSDWDFGYKIRPYPGGGYILFGETYSFGNGNNDVYVVKIDNDGSIEWEQTVGDENDDTPADFKIDDAGLIYALYQGSSGEDDNHSQEIAVVNGLGTIIDVDSKDEFDYTPKAIEFVDDDYYVAGFTMNEEGNSQLYGIRMDENFSEIWAYDSPSDGNDGFVDVVFYNNRLQITGFTENVGYGQRDILAFRAFASTGGWQWSAAFGYNLNDFPSQIYMDSDNSVLHVGTSKGQINASSDVFVIKYDNPSIPLTYAIDSDVYQDISLSVESFLESYQEHQLVPNPCKESFEISGLGKNKVETIKLFDASGRIVDKEDYSIFGNVVDVNKIQSGLYFVLYQVGDMNYSLSLIINK